MFVPEIDHTAGSIADQRQTAIRAVNGQTAEDFDSFCSRGPTLRPRGGARAGRPDAFSCSARAERIVRPEGRAA